MDCQSCNKKNEEDAIYCEFCGTKLIQPDSMKTVPLRRKKRKFIRRYGVLTFQILLSLLLIGVFWINGRAKSSPQRMAAHYFESVAAGDWDNVYDYFQISENKFINRENFLKNSYSIATINYTDYTVTSAEYYRDSETGRELAALSIIYRESESGAEQTYQVTLEKAAKKQYLFFDQWQVMPEEMLGLSTVMEVPAGCTVKVDGVALEDKEQTNGEMDYYYIAGLFRGEHLVELEAKYMQSRQEIIYVPPGEAYQYYGEHLLLDQDTSAKLYSMSRERLKQIYESGMGRAEYNQISTFFSADAAVQAAMQEKYGHFLAVLCDEAGYGLKMIDFNDLQGELSTAYYEGRLEVRVQLSMSYQGQVIDISGEDGTRVERAVSGTDYIVSFSYLEEAGEWVLKDYSFNPVDK